MPIARKFLFVVAGLVFLVLLGAVGLRLFSTQLTRFATVPPGAFAAQPAFTPATYNDPALWIARPGKPGEAAAQYLPTGAVRRQPLDAAVFFIHPTSYLVRAGWNAPLTDADSRSKAELFVRSMGSVFGDSAEVWAPRYRQATFGAFLTDRPDATKALDLAYGDVLAAFDRFAADAGKDRPIILAGHSQGAVHLLRLLKDRIAGKPIAARIAAVYVVGWPVSRAHDLPLTGLTACTGPAQAHCLMSWQSFAEPATPPEIGPGFPAARALDGGYRLDAPPVCTNPLTGGAPGNAPASLNRGALVPAADLASAKLVPALVPARCDARGLLLIGEPQDVGPFVMPGNNYHLYDMMLFWQNLRGDAAGRVAAWRTAAK